MGNNGSSAARTVRIVVALFAVACFMVGGAATGVYLAVRHIVATTTIHYAKALGIALEPSEVRFGPWFVQVIDAKFTALEIPGVTGTIRRIDVDLEGLRPSHLLLSGVNLEVKGDPLPLRDAALRYWNRVQTLSATLGAGAGRQKPLLPRLEWRHLAVNMTTGNPLAETVTLTELDVTANVGPTQDEMVIRTATTHVGSFDLGALEVVTRVQNGTIELGWGPTLLESKWRVAYREQDQFDELKFSFVPVEAKEIFARFGVTTAIAGLDAAKVAGHIEARRDKAKGKTEGTSTFTLSGFVPPYPPELKGYRFADTSTIRAQFEADPLLLAVELRGIELKTGDLTLVGHGRLDRELFSVRIRADLSANLDCVTLAKGYSNEVIGGELGAWGAQSAPKAVQGGVAVRVQIDADPGHLDRAKIVKRIGIGCGLRPMSVVDLLNLGLPPIPDPKTIERLMKQFPPGVVMANLPTLPQLFPQLGTLPGIGKRSTATSGTSPHAPATSTATGQPLPTHSAAK